MNVRVLLRCVVLAGTVVLMGACIGIVDGGTDSPDVEDPLANVIQAQTEEVESIMLTRRAIYMGLDIGEGLLIDSINAVLLDHAIPFSVASLDDVDPPAPVAACPYIENLANAASTSLSCRYLAERARDRAYVEVPNAIAAAPLGPEFLEAGDYTTHELWYSRGSISGADGAFSRAIFALRDGGACDQDPGPVESSFSFGIEHGRVLFADALATQLSNTPPTQCDIDNGIVEPARNAAVLTIESYVASNPLCPELETSSIDDLLEFAQAGMEYRRGVAEGIDEASVVAAQDLLNTWVCVVPPPPESPDPPAPTGGWGDPLVLDIAGDGIEFGTVRSGPIFDILGEGLRAHTAWILDDNALLALDRDGDGRIGSGLELLGDRMRGPSGARYRSGFEALAALDHPAMGGNADGVIDSRDRAYGELVLWQDRDGDGVSQPGELIGLAEAGVASIALASTRGPERSSGDAVIVETGTFLRVGGGEGTVVEAFFATR